MIAFKLALRNLLGAGLRTWLTVAVLSFSFVVIIFYNGIIDGWNQQARKDTREWEIGSGQLWHPEYDPFDVYTYQDAHAPLSEKLDSLVQNNILVPVLITQATAYPGGRMQSVVLKGIKTKQNLLKLPTSLLESKNGEISALIGFRMAKSLKTEKGERLLIRWRDKNGTFDAVEVKIADIFHCNVPNIDNGQIWLHLKKLQEMLGLPG
jgi:ABC-type lipoprotein release transport system permease subunit